MAYKRDVLPCAAALLALTLSACSSNHATSPVEHSVFGSVYTTDRHLLPGVTVRLTPATGSPLAAVTTDTTGSYVVFHVPAGQGTIAVSGAPVGCMGTNPSSYFVESNGATVVNIVVLCP